MAYDENLAQRIRSTLPPTPEVVEKKMFGGLAFMLNGNMCCGVVKDSLMVRVGAENYTAALAAAHVRPMDFTGRPMKSMVLVDPPALAEDAALQAWVDRCVVFVQTLPKK